MNKQIITLAVFFLGTFYLHAQHNISIQHLGNMGVLVNTATGNIIFDGIFAPIEENWCESVPDSILNNIIDGNSSFQEIDILFISHHHRDHFSDTLVASFLKKHPNTTIVCPQQVANKLIPLLPSTLKNNISAIPNLPEPIKLKIKDFNITAINLAHSPTMVFDTVFLEKVNKHANIQNTAYIVNQNNVSVFHSGDADPNSLLANLKFTTGLAPCNLVVLDRIIWNKSTIAPIIKGFAPKKIILMHIRPSNKGAFLKYANSEPNIHVFSIPGQILHLPTNEQ
jgi:L-ascorbate metabolism protein UlaG (beta-lactamase superfamily)